MTKSHGEQAAGENMQGDSPWLLPSFDARDWAIAFMATFADRRDEIDETVLITWFANALRRGYDEHARHHADRSKR